MSDINVILLDDSQVFMTDLQEICKTTNISIDQVNSEKELFEALSTVQYNVAIIDISVSEPSDLSVIALLRKNTGLGIIVVTTDLSSSKRNISYDNGADHFFIAPIDDYEITAVIRNLHTRLSQLPISAPKNTVPYWQLNKTSWCLISPANNEVQLTAKEVEFLQILLSQVGKNIARTSLTANLGYSSDEYGSRSIDSLVQRLRRKVLTQLSLKLPLQTVHAVGYCFSAPAQIISTNNN